MLRLRIFMLLLSAGRLIVNGISSDLSKYATGAEILQSKLCHGHPPPHAASSPARLVAVVCAAQVLVQIGAFFWPALLPGMMRLWQLTNSEAGWITASFYGAYMVSVPVLVTLTDRVDPKRVYLFGVASTVVGPLAVRIACRGFLVRPGSSCTHRHGVGRHLYDGPQASGRSRRRQDDVARHGRSRGKHRHFWCSLICNGRPHCHPLPAGRLPSSLQPLALQLRGSWSR